jgi:F0F1-type ATP synthase epsilon subunit
MLDVTVINAREIMFKGQASSVILPGESGVFEVLSFHKRILSRLVQGNIDIDGDAFPILRGIVKVEDNNVTAIVEQERDGS